MVLGDLNFLLLAFYFLLFSFIINNNHVLFLLLTAELIWVLLYAFSLLVSFIYNDLNVLSLSLFFLVFSAAELAIGLSLMILQNSIYKSLYLVDNTNNTFKFVKRLQSRLFLNKIKWESFF